LHSKEALEALGRVLRVKFWLVTKRVHQARGIFSGLGANLNTEKGIRSCSVLTARTARSDGRSAGNINIQIEPDIAIRLELLHVPQWLTEGDIEKLERKQKQKKAIVVIESIIVSKRWMIMRG
jgi:hypothetical protein